MRRLAAEAAAFSPPAWHRQRLFVCHDESVTGWRTRLMGRSIGPAADRAMHQLSRGVAEQRPEVGLPAAVGGSAMLDVLDDDRVL